MLLLPLYERRLPSVHVRVEQDLVRGGLDLRRREQRLEVRNLEVANTDAPKWRSVSGRRRNATNRGVLCLPVRLDFLHFCPGCSDIWNSEARAVDEVEIDILDAQLPEISVLVVNMNTRSSG